MFVVVLLKIFWVYCCEWLQYCMQSTDIIITVTDHYSQFTWRLTRLNQLYPEVFTSLYCLCLYMRKLCSKLQPNSYRCYLRPHKTNCLQGATGNAQYNRLDCVTSSRHSLIYRQPNILVKILTLGSVLCPQSLALLIIKLIFPTCQWVRVTRIAYISQFGALTCNASNCEVTFRVFQYIKHILFT